MDDSEDFDDLDLALEDIEEEYGRSLRDALLPPVEPILVSPPDGAAVAIAREF